MPDAVIGVLLPLRIETRFDEPTADGAWQVRMLLVPDEPSVDRLDPRPRASELASLAAIATSATLDRGQARDLLRRLAERHGAQRAAWLFRRYVSGTGEGPFTHDRKKLGADRKTAPNRPAARRASRLAGLPPRIAVYALWRGDPVPRLLGTTPLDPAELERDPIENRDETWWSSWK